MPISARTLGLCPSSILHATHLELLCLWLVKLIDGSGGHHGPGGAHRSKKNHSTPLTCGSRAGDKSFQTNEGHGAAYRHQKQIIFAGFFGGGVVCCGMQRIGGATADNDECEGPSRPRGRPVLCLDTISSKHVQVLLPLPMLPANIWSSLTPKGTQHAGHTELTASGATVRASTQANLPPGRYLSAKYHLAPSQSACHAKQALHTATTKAVQPLQGASKHTCGPIPHSSTHFMRCTSAQSLLLPPTQEGTPLRCSVSGFVKSPSPSEQPIALPAHWQQNAICAPLPPPHTQSHTCDSHILSKNCHEATEYVSAHRGKCLQEFAYQGTR
eukprot:411988-Pelagomonas_calceolata.AAC.2